MKKLFSLMIAFFAVSPAMAYITGTMGKGTLNPNVRTHIFIIGNGGDLGTALGNVAATKAKKYKDLYPNDQIYMLSVNETSKDDVNVQELAAVGFDNLTVKGSGFKSKNVLEEMMAFNQIASVDIMSHSVAYYGVILDGKFNRMDPKKDGYDALKGHFTADAYAFLHGCNSGQLLAPIFSSAWGIPVAGSFTGTDFQFVSTNKQFYNDDERRPNGISKSTVNSVSYERNAGCYQGACMRLFPDNFAYGGYWGSFREGGLGFYKWFCSNNDEKRCFTAMARAALSYVSVKSLRENSSLEDYKEVVYDYLCPQNRKEVCREALIAAEKGGSMTPDFYQSKTLQCDFKSCKAKFKCQAIPFVDLLKKGSCTVENLRASDKTTTLADEYIAYLKGYKLLQAELSAKR